MVNKLQNTILSLQKDGTILCTELIQNAISDNVWDYYKDFNFFNVTIGFDKEFFNVDTYSYITKEFDV